ncbi:MAG: hypothetical protein ABSG93_12115 [Solirubrobacteraceae bacterium]
MGADVVLGRNPDGLEDGLVHQAAGIWLGAEVEVVQVVAGEPENEREELGQRLVPDRQAGNDRLGVQALALHALDFLAV